MAFNHRMLGPYTAAHQTRVVNKRSYTAVAGQVVTVPQGDGEVLAANNWTLIALSGSTANRPTGKLGRYSMVRGTVFWDETLNQLIISDGTNWRDPLTGNVV